MDEISKFCKNLRINEQSCREKLDKKLEQAVPLTRCDDEIKPYHGRYKLLEKEKEDITDTL